jgi:antitoxin (DNA-binding transcriptional repressor) of toxin-antitoxin stability system
MLPMEEIEVDDLGKNIRAVIAATAADGPVLITDDGNPIAMITAPPRSRLEQLIAAGLASRPTRNLRDLPAPTPSSSGVSPSELVIQMRGEERY